MSKRGKNNNNNKKPEIQSNRNNDNVSSTNSEENRQNGDSSRLRKKYIYRLILKNKNCISYGLHTKIFKVHSFTYKGKRYIYDL